MPKLTTPAEVSLAKKLAEEVPVNDKHNPKSNKTQDRLTMVVNIHHEHWGDKPFSVEFIGNKLLTEQAEPYGRNVIATEEWKPVPYGDVPVAKVGLVVIENKAGIDELTRPSLARQAEIDRQVIEVAYRTDSTEADLVGPGGIGLKFVSDATKLMFRSQRGDIRCRVSVITK